MTLMFDSPLKKLTESETVIAELVVEDILAWLHEQKLPLYVARTPFGDIRVEYGLNAETFTTIETPWGSGAEALYLGDYKREVALSPRPNYRNVGTRFLTKGKKTPQYRWQWCWRASFARRLSSNKI